jgi:hypothetical protein
MHFHLGDSNSEQQAIEMDCHFRFSKFKTNTALNRRKTICSRVKNFYEQENQSKLNPINISWILLALE